MQPPTSRSVRESPAEYLSRYADRLGQPVSDDDPTFPPPDPFQLHATILRSQLQAMLAPRRAVPPGDEAIALAGLWSRVREQPRGPWDTDALASSLGVSRATLYRMVKRHHGMSPGKVVEGLRMEEARRLLSESQHPIEVIAEQVGYASAFSFSASFKRVAGEPPSRFGPSERSGSEVREDPTGLGECAEGRPRKPGHPWLNGRRQAPGIGCPSAPRAPASPAQRLRALDREAESPRARRPGQGDAPAGS
jgi:AraC-like DNA-binding protein